MTQSQSIYKDLKKGKKITALDALNRYGCLRLASRINEFINDGVPIKKKMITVGKKGKRVMEYSL